MIFDGVFIRSEKHQCVKLVSDFELASSNPKWDERILNFTKK